MFPDWAAKVTIDKNTPGVVHDTALYAALVRLCNHM
jgi:hypothetical protein